MLRKIFFILLITIIFTQAHAQVIYLGSSIDLSGPIKDTGSRYIEGALMYIDYANEYLLNKYGVRIEVITNDDGYNPNRAVKNTEEFIKNDVFCLFSYTGTAPSLATAQFLLSLNTTRKFFLFGAYTGASSIRALPESINVINIRSSYFKVVEKALEFIRSKNWKKIGLFIWLTDYGIEIRNSVLKVLKQRGMEGLEIVAETTFMATDTEFSRQVKYLKENGAEVIITAISFKMVGILAQELQKQKYFVPLIIFNWEPYLLKEYYGKLYPLNLFYSFLNTPIPYDNYKACVEYRNLAKEYGKDINMDAFEGFLNAKAFVGYLQKFIEKYKKIPTSTEFYNFVFSTTLDIGLDEPLEYSLNPFDNEGINKVFGYTFNEKGQVIPIKY